MGNYRMAICLVALLGATPALAAPTYMTCVFTNSEGAKSEVKVTADEANASVSIYVPSSGHSQRASATFTPDRLIFRTDMLDYMISRTDLGASRTIRSISSTDKGVCKVDPAPKRAF